MSNNECIIDVLTGADAVIIYAHYGICETVMRLSNPTPVHLETALEAVVFGQLNQHHPDRIVMSEKTEKMLPDSVQIYIGSIHTNLAVQDGVTFSNRLRNEKICRYSPNLIVKFEAEKDETRGAA
jgi:hypothetical protein